MNPQPLPQGQPYQPPIPGQLFQPPHQGQPFQPPHQGHAPHQGQPFQPPQPGQPLPPTPAQPPLQQPGPPAKSYPGRSPLWPAAVGVLAVVTLAAAYWLGTYLAVYGNSGVAFYLLIALVGGAVGGLVAVWSDTASQLRVWGSDLFGKTALGWRRLDLAGITSVGISGQRGRNTIILRDRQGQIAFSDKRLEPVLEGVRRGVFEAAQQGRVVVPTALAELLGLPVQQGAPKRRNSTLLPILGGVLLILIGVALGLVIAS